MISIATVVQLSKAAMDGTSVFIEHDNALGWTDFVYGCIASANLIGDVLSLLFAENSVRITGSDGMWFYVVGRVTLRIESGERFEFHLDKEAMQRHMADHRLQFLETGGDVKPWIKKKNIGLEEDVRAENAKVFFS